ncbi:MAG: dicarboxylate/amino acid:cation symporter [Myxococcota bacterium]
MSTHIWIVIGALAGMGTGLWNQPTLMEAAAVVATVFIRLLKLVSIPLIFFSLLSTLTGMGSVKTAKRLGGLVFRYTLLTTLIAAGIALALFLAIDPVGEPLLLQGDSVQQHGNYQQHLMQVVPGNFLTPFVQGNVVSVLLLAALLSFAVLGLQQQRRQRLHTLFADLFAAIMEITALVLRLLPLAVWAFVAEFCVQISGQTIGNLALYLLCVLAANLLQATVVLPLLLVSKGFSPRHTFRCMLPALTVAFFAKSSSAALPVAMRSAQERLKLPQQVTQFSFPLCTTINMNACAAFILITVLFVSMHHGIVYAPWELAALVVVATVAAIGNAGVPMGCYLLSTAILASLNIPLHLMGVILPFYALIDMLESAINVWSDACVSCAVSADLQTAAADSAA